MVFLFRGRLFGGCCSNLPGKFVLCPGFLPAKSWMILRRLSVRDSRAFWDKGMEGSGPGLAVSGWGQTPHLQREAAALRMYPQK